MADFDHSAEWLETDGLGGFACGAVSGVRTRRYHGLLLCATQPPTGRVLLVNGFDAWVESASRTCALTSQHYAPGVLHPDSGLRAESFAAAPWPTWVFRLPDGRRIRHEIFVRHGAPLVAMAWRLEDEATERRSDGATKGCEQTVSQSNARAGVVLNVRPFLSGRDYHSLQHENPRLRFEPAARGSCLIWQTYPDMPEVWSLANAEYRHEPYWYRNFEYAEEQARGQDYLEDLAAPGILRFDLEAGPAVWILAAGEAGRAMVPDCWDPAASLAALRETERRRRAAFATPLERAADAYLMRRGAGRTIVAGYPWFTDWGRDTFIALRGLCLATGRLDDAQAILLEWSGAVSEGMLPNRFPDQGEAPDYNAVDASLWYVVVVDEFLRAAATVGLRVTPAERARLEDAVRAILAGYERGTRFGIRCDADGLLAAGQPGVQLTWMDAKVGDWVVTPRIGKPVEVQALWLNALWSARRLSERWGELFERGRASFQARFWNEAGGCLYDVVDCAHQPGRVDARLRPNQIFAVGGLPVALVEGQRARKVVDIVEEQLWTPLGLRTLAPADPAYVPHYRGDVRARDGAYHQGTAWPWLLGPFVEAWVRVRGDTPEARRLARERFLTPLFEHLSQAGLGHVSEVVDGDPPHKPGGCPFQAWSLGELLRLERVVLAG